jgi:hypothetical protein
VRLRVKTVAVFAAALSLVLIAGAAFAYWTISGEGVGKAKASSGGAPLEVGSAPVEQLYPGASKEATVTIKDVDPKQPEYVGSLEAEVKTTSEPVKCLASWFTVTPAKQSVGTELTAGKQITKTVTVEMKDEPSVNQDACKGQEIELAYKAS